MVQYQLRKMVQAAEFHPLSSPKRQVSNVQNTKNSILMMLRACIYALRAPLNPDCTSSCVRCPLARLHLARDTYPRTPRM